MTTATEFLDAFNNSFVNKDSSYLDAIMAENCTIHFTGLHQTMTRRECLDWSESGFRNGCDNYEIVQDTDASIAGTHRAWGSAFGQDLPGVEWDGFSEDILVQEIKFKM